MISFSNENFSFINFLAKLFLYLCSHLDLVVNLQIIIGDANEATEVRESRGDQHIRT